LGFDFSLFTSKKVNLRLLYINVLYKWDVAIAGPAPVAQHPVAKEMVDAAPADVTA
jgi:hypothetical protein